MRRLPLVHALAAALVDDALGVAEEDVLRLHAERLDQFDAGDAGGPGAVADEPGGGDVAAGEMQRVDEAGRGDDRGAVLVVVEHRNVHQLAQARLDDEAVRRLDVLEVDAAERRPQVAHAIDECVDVLGLDLEIDRIDVGEALEQDRLALHHRLRGEGAEVAEAEDGGAVGNDRDHVAARRVVEGGIRIGGDGQHRHGDARRIGQRQVALGRHWLGGDHLELARPSFGVEFQRFLVGDGRAGLRRLLALGHVF